MVRAALLWDPSLALVPLLGPGSTAAPPSYKTLSAELSPSCESSAYTPNHRRDVRGTNPSTGGQLGDTRPALYPAAEHMEAPGNLRPGVDTRQAVFSVSQRFSRTPPDDPTTETRVTSPFWG